MFYDIDTCGLYYKNITIVNDTSRVIRVTIVSDTPLSPMIVILMTLEALFMLLEHIYSTGVTHDDRHLRLSYFYSTSLWFQCLKTFFVVTDDNPK
jgi:hypothetical protein